MKIAENRNTENAVAKLLLSMKHVCFSTGMKTLRRLLNTTLIPVKLMVQMLTMN